MVGFSYLSFWFDFNHMELEFFCLICSIPWWPGLHINPPSSWWWS